MALMVVAIAAMVASPSHGQPTLALLNDLVLDNDALLFPSSAPYGRAINGVSYQTEALLTVGDYQYASWYHWSGSQRDIYLARRLASSTTWQVMDTGANMTRTTNDAHNVISMGISGDGRIHMSYDHHNHTLRYRNTTVGAATGGTWNSSIFNPEQSFINQGGATINDVTYPQFVTDPDSGDAYMLYRTGLSGNGNEHLAVYDFDTGAWQAPHEIINGTSINVNPYINGMNVDTNGRLHTTWTWRPEPGSTNYNIMYAYSDDRGSTWKNGAGISLGGLISSASPGIIIEDNNSGNGLLGEISLSNTLMNQQTQAVDLDGRVHAIMWHAADAHVNTVSGFDTTKADYFHYFRDPTTGAWSRTILPTSREVGSRADMAYDAAGNVYAVYVSPGAGDLGGYYTDGDLVIAGATKAANYNDWSILHTDTRDFAGEPLIDQNRLLNHGILSVFIQENDAAVTTTTGTPLRVLDFSVDTYHFWVGDNSGVWNNNTGTDWDSNHDGTGNAAFTSGKIAQFDDGASTFTVPIAAPVSPGHTRFDNTSMPYTLTGAGIIGSGHLYVVGGGNVTLANGANSYSGETHLNNGILALSGAATISASPHIKVASGGTFDVTAVTGGFYTLNAQTLTIDGDVVGNVVAANNSIVHVNSANSMDGNLTAQSGSLVAGAGRITGNLTAQSNSIIRVGGDGVASVPVVSGPATYVDATSGAGGNTTRSNGTVFNPKPEGTTGADNDWEIRNAGNGGTLIESGGETAENAYEIKTKITGLTPGNYYQVHALFWDPTSNVEDWNVRAGFTSNPGGNTLFSAADAISDLGGATAAPLTSSLSYVANPLFAEANRVSLAARVGNQIANENGEIEVFIDDMPSAIGANRRTWYDGLAYSPMHLEGETLTVEGNVELDSTATLKFDIVSPSIVDLLNVTGTFTAGGTLSVSLMPGAPSPQLGATFDILDFASASGAFAAFDLPVLARGLSWNTSNLLTTGVLQVIASGDYNNDGIVDAADYVVWRKSDGLPDGYTSWSENFGEPSGGGSADNGSSRVPEPTTLALLIGVIAVAALSPRLRRGVFSEPCIRSTPDRAGGCRQVMVAEPFHRH